MSQKVRVAMLSFAHVHAEGYARQVEENPEAEIVVIWDEEEYGGREAAERHKVPFCEDLDEVLSRDDVDGVVVNAPTSMHKELMVAAAQAGKHIFTEKALALTVDECDRIIEAVEKAGVKFMISLPSRCSPDILLAKKVVDEGIIGEVTMGRGRIAHSAALDGWFPPGNWFGDPKRAGGGALFDLGCHRVDVIRWLMGMPKSVVAKINNFTHRYDIDDNSVTLVEFENNAIGIIDVTWIHRSGPNMLELYGTEGSLLIGHPKGMILTSTRFSSDEEAQKYIRENRPEPLSSPMQQWVSAILHDTPMSITIQDGRNLTELLQAAYISAEEGREVRLPL
jgi:predicted dehydrogenase